MPDPQADYDIDLDWPEADPDDDIPATLPPILPPPPPVAITASADRDLAVVQATAAQAARAEAGDVKSGEVIRTGDYVELLGKEFRIADRVGLMPLLKFASASDVETSDPRALSAMYALLRDCIWEGTPACGKCSDCEAGNDRACKEYNRGDWPAFEEHAMVTKASAEDLMDVVAKVLEVVTGRPTEPRSPSSTGQRATSGASTGRSSSRGRRGSRR